MFYQVNIRQAQHGTSPLICEWDLVKAACFRDWVAHSPILPVPSAKKGRYHRVWLRFLWIYCAVLLHWGAFTAIYLHPHHKAFTNLCDISEKGPECSATEGGSAVQHCSLWALSKRYPVDSGTHTHTLHTCTRSPSEKALESLPLLFNLILAGSVLPFKTFC